MATKTTALAVKQGDMMSRPTWGHEIEQLATDVIAGKEGVQDWLQKCAALRKAFDHNHMGRNQWTKKPTYMGEIHGCTTWTEFCEKHLNYSPRHMRRLLKDENPASAKHDGSKNRKKKPKKPTRKELESNLVNVRAVNAGQEREIQALKKGTVTPPAATPPPVTETQVFYVLRSTTPTIDGKYHTSRGLNIDAKNFSDLLGIATHYGKPGARHWKAIENRTVEFVRVEASYVLTPVTEEKP